MALCIASPAEDQASGTSIVLCFDHLISDDPMLCELSFRDDASLAPCFAVMVAQDIEDSTYLIQFCKHRLSGSATFDSVKEQLWQGMQDFKRALAGIGRDHSDVQLLVLGFIENEPMIIYLDEQGPVASEAFLAIGPGGAAAEAMLTWRKLTRHTPLDEAIYYLYEAKRIAEAFPLVGKSTTILTMQNHPEKPFVVCRLSEDCIEQLSNQFEKIGPQSYFSESPFLWKPLL